MRSIALIFTGCSLWFAGTAQAAVTPYVSITSSALSPHAGSPFVLTASSTGAGISYAWDLDGDGAFDDATGARATAMLPEGTPTVGVLATDADGRTATETRTMVVHAFNVQPVPRLTLAASVPRVGVPFDVTASGVDADGSVTEIELDLDGDGTYEVASAAGAPVTRSASFSTAGLRTLRARVTDDTGATAEATAQVDVSAANSAPRVTIYARAENGTNDDPLRAGKPIEIAGTASDEDGSVARYEFDLDGDGSYETDNGTDRDVITTFTGGPHEIGVRVTDDDGTSATSRRTLSIFVGDLYGWPTIAPVFDGDATTDVPADLGVEIYGGGPYTVAWDLDGDGQFDDDTSTLPAADIPRESHLAHTFATSGIRRIGAKATDGHGNVLTVMQTLTVRDAAAAGIKALELPATLAPGVDTPFLVRAPGGVALTYDLDGDGDFDDTPTIFSGARMLALAGPATVAVKATAGTSSVVHSVELSPLAGNLGPFPQIEPVPTLAMPAGLGPFAAGYLTTVTAFINDLDSTCCSSWARFDLDGDGVFGDQNELVPRAGAYSIVLDGGDETSSATVRQTFLVEGEPGADFLRDDLHPVLKPPAGPQPTPLPKPAATLTIKSVKGSAKGVSLVASCTCRTTIVVKLGSKTLARVTGNGGFEAVRFSAKARRQLAKARGRKLTITISTPGAKTVSKTVALKR